MRRSIIILSLFFSFISTQNIQAQLSDYQIKTEFEEQFRELRTALNSAYSVDEIDSLRKEIDSLRIEYKEHEELLSAALYPHSFEEHLQQLDTDVKIVEHRLLIIENQNDRLDTLMSELASYESEIKNLNERVAALRSSVANSESSEKELSELVRNYRNNLERRDQFILGVIDSMLLRYEDLTANDVSELSEGAESGKVSDEENPLVIINSIIEENLKILKSSGEELSTEDYLRMYVVQHRFEEVWDQIGDELAVIYGNKDEQEWKSNIEEKLDDWRASTSRNMWESMDVYLEERNVQLTAFDNRESFYQALDEYVKQASEESDSKWFTSGNYDEFQNFYEFWNGKIKNDWSNYVQDGKVLTMQQISTIDSEIVNWRDNAKPASYLMPILLGLSLLIIVGLIVVIARKKD